jgi:uncharacterized phage infection (PIP) family protein YhgE
MSFWVLIQVLTDLILAATVVFLWAKLSRPTKDDPRLSRGLQLLQSKISVLEDLSDRTETQVHQVNSLMEQKVKEMQNQVLLADKQIQKIESSMGRSLEVAKIFQDKIPHQEIIERQNTIKYVKAARMAHQGASVEEIAREVNLSHGEIEFISKVNKEQLQFDENDLPGWVREELEIQPQVQTPGFRTEKTELSQLGDKFRQALQQQQNTVPQQMVESAVPQNPLPPESLVVEVRKPLPKVSTSVQTRDQIRKFEFPRVERNDISRNLG